MSVKKYYKGGQEGSSNDTIPGPLDSGGQLLHRRSGSSWDL